MKIKHFSVCCVCFFGLLSASEDLSKLSEEQENKLAQSIDVISTNVEELRSILRKDSGINPRAIVNAFTYVDFGVGPFPILLPSFALGHRNQWGHHGFDISVYTSTIVAMTQVKNSILYLYYFKPDLQSQVYMGVGPGTSALCSSKVRMCISPEFIFGKEYKSKEGGRRFFQAQISFPTYDFRKGNMFYFPLVVFSYGIGF